MHVAPICLFHAPSLACPRSRLQFNQDGNILPRKTNHESSDFSEFFKKWCEYAFPSCIDFSITTSQTPSGTTVLLLQFKEKPVGCVQQGPPNRADVLGHAVVPVRSSGAIISQLLAPVPYAFAVVEPSHYLLNCILPTVNRLGDDVDEIVQDLSEILGPPAENGFCFPTFFSRPDDRVRNSVR